jgi:hypothetical protein
LIVCPTHFKNTLDLSDFWTDLLQLPLDQQLLLVYWDSLEEIFIHGRMSEANPFID